MNHATPITLDDGLSGLPSGFHFDELDSAIHIVH